MSLRFRSVGVSFASLMLLGFTPNVAAEFCGIEVQLVEYCTRTDSGGIIKESCKTDQEIVDSPCGQGTGGGGGGGTGPPPPPTNVENPVDRDEDGQIDCFLSVAGVANPASFETDDFVGTEFGGENFIDECHTGIDFDCQTGDAVYSGFAGIVDVANYFEDSGNMVRVTAADGSVSDYLHLDSISVSEGDWVQPGDYLGACGETGTLANAPHLHYRVALPATSDPYPNCPGVGKWTILNPLAGSFDCDDYQP